MSKLRERMIEDMRLAGLAAKTQEEYIRAVSQLSVKFGVAPDRISEEQLRQYLVGLQKSVACGTFQVKYHGIKFFYYRTLCVNWALLTRIKIRKPRQKRMPRTVCHDEFLRILSALSNPAYRLCIQLMYFCGLRISEAVSLPVKAIDSQNMVFRIIGKGNKERLVPFPENLLEPMRSFWKTHSNLLWLFPARGGLWHMPSHSLGTAFRMARAEAHIDKDITPHCLRHTFATRLIERGVSIGVVQMLLRHSSIRSTQVYMHMTEPLRQDVHDSINDLFDALDAKGGKR